MTTPQMQNRQMQTRAMLTAPDLDGGPSAASGKAYKGIEFQTARLIYVSDPMCSWCWGFAGVWAQILPRLRPGLQVQWVLGGLAPDSVEPMDLETQRYVQSAWRAVAQTTGAEFNFDFWSRCTPSRSTWPACRAVLAAGKFGLDMFAAIQRAYYTEARDPSQRSVLLELAAELDLPVEAFQTQLDHPATQAQLELDFALRDALRCHGMPSVTYVEGGQASVLTRGWCDAETLLQGLQGLGLLGEDLR